MAVAQMQTEQTASAVKSDDPPTQATPKLSGGTSSNGNQDLESQEIKLLRRRESNRDSARRTRRRKASEYKRLGQEVNDLGRENIRLRQQVQDLAETNKVLIESVPKLADKCKELVAENLQLKELVRALRQQQHVPSHDMQMGPMHNRSHSIGSLYPTPHHQGGHHDVMMDLPQMTYQHNPGPTHLGAGGGMKQEQPRHEVLSGGVWLADDARERREREGEGTGQGGGPSSHRGNMEAYSPGLGQLGTPGLGPTIIVTPPTIGHSHVLRESSPLIDAASPRISDLDPHMFLPRGYPPESAIGTMRHD